jgi:hypothetical protein
MTSAVQGIKDKECLSSHRESGIQDKSWPQPSQGYRTMAGLSRLRDTGPGMASAVEGIPPASYRMGSKAAVKDQGRSRRKG